MKTGEEQQEAEPGLLPGRLGKGATKKAAWGIARGPLGISAGFCGGPWPSSWSAHCRHCPLIPHNILWGSPVLSKKGSRPHGFAGLTKETDLRKVSVTEQRDDGKDRLEAAGHCFSGVGNLLETCDARGN